MNRLVFISLISLLMHGLSSSNAPAELITFGFEGVVTWVEDADDVLGGGVVPGTPFLGAYTFESDTPDSSGRSELGVYPAITQFWAVAGPFFLVGPILGNNDIRVGNNLSVDGRDGYSITPDVMLDEYSVAVLVNFHDSSGTVYLDDSLPLTPPPFQTFRFQEHSLQFTVRGTITATTPEPATLLLVLLGGVGIMRRDA